MDCIKLRGLEIRNNPIGWGMLVEHARGNVNKSATHIELSNLYVYHTAGISLRPQEDNWNIIKMLEEIAGTEIKGEFTLEEADKEVFP